MKSTRFYPLVLGVAAGLLAGCDSSRTTDPPLADRSALLTALDVAPADLDGVDVDALTGPLDAGAIVEAIRTSKTGEAAGGKGGPPVFVRPGESIQAAVSAAPAGGIVYVRPGVYTEAVTITKSVHLVGLGGPGAVVIQDPGGKANGIDARGVTGLSLINLTIRGFANNGVFIVGADGFVLSRLVTDGLRETAYGLFPVRSRNGLIAHCTTTGADDSGVYLGQSENVAVVHNEAYGNVIGFEAENVRQTTWAHNRAYDNAAGMLAILLPPSQYVSVLHAEELVVAHNRFTDNNLANFAEDGALASFVPSGSGLLVFGYDDSVIEHNHVTGHATFGIGLASTVTLWLAAGRDLTRLAAIEPHPDNVRVVKNQVTGNGFGPDLVLPGLGALPSVDLLWDRPIIDLLAQAIPGFPYGTYGTGNCWAQNRYDTSFPPTLPSCAAL